jgi:hypothetical protein
VLGDVLDVGVVPVDVHDRCCTSTMPM